MRIRAAGVDDAPAMGLVMVESWLSAHRGQIPDAAWQKRLEEWTPEVSARGWARAMSEQTESGTTRDVFLVAEDEARTLIGLVSGTAADDDPSGSIAEIGALYVTPARRGQGVGTALLRAASGELAEVGFSGLQVGVLSANLPARAFYRAMGASEIGDRMFDEEGHLVPLTIYAWPDIGSLSSESIKAP